MTVQTSPSLRKTASPSAGSCAPAVGAASRPRRRTFATRPSIPSSRAVASALVSRAAASPQLAHARLLLTRDAGARCGEAAALLTSALATARELGMDGLVAKVRRLGLDAAPTAGAQEI